MASYSMAGPTTSTPPVLRSFSQRSKSRSGCTEPMCTWATFKTLVTWTMKSWLVHDMILISWLILIHNWVGFHPQPHSKKPGLWNIMEWSGLGFNQKTCSMLERDENHNCCGLPPKGRNRKLLRMGGWISWRSAKTSNWIQIMILHIKIYNIYIYTYIHETPSWNNFSWIWTWPSWSFLWQQKHVLCLCKTIDNWHLPLQGDHISKPSHPWRNPNGHSHAVVCAGSGAIHQSNVANKKCTVSIEWIEQIHQDGVRKSEYFFNVQVVSKSFQNCEDENNSQQSLRFYNIHHCMPKRHIPTILV